MNKPLHRVSVLNSAKLKMLFLSLYVLFFVVQYLTFKLKHKIIVRFESFLEYCKVTLNVDSDSIVDC